MHHITANNINDAYYQAIQLMEKHREVNSSRNGEVYVVGRPVITEIINPQLRVLSSAARDANPFFHMMEALWMLAGKNDLFPGKFASNIYNYSDDGETLNGAYGHRWRRYWRFDQLKSIINTLKQDRNSRRAVLTMWDPVSDLDSDSLDLPCNTHIYFRADTGVLDMTVCNRSNDIIWGLYGANAVHMSVLQEFVSRATGNRMGSYYTLSNNWHMYPDKVDLRKLLDEEPYDFYSGNTSFREVPMFRGDIFWQDFLEEVEAFIKDAAWGAKSDYSFIRSVAYPMWKVWEARKDKEEAYKLCLNILAEDWREACSKWILRRVKNGSHS